MVRKADGNSGSGAAWALGENRPAIDRTVMMTHYSDQRKTSLRFMRVVQIPSSHVFGGPYNYSLHACRIWNLGS